MKNALYTRRTGCEVYAPVKRNGKPGRPPKYQFSRPMGRPKTTSTKANFTQDINLLQTNVNLLTQDNNGIGVETVQFGADENSYLTRGDQTLNNTLQDKSNSTMMVEESTVEAPTP